MSKVIYDVLPVPNGYVIRLAGDSQSEFAPDKATAIQRARQLGSQCTEWHVRVLSAGGAVENEYSSEKAEHPSH